MGVLNAVHRSSTFFQPVRDATNLAGHVGLVSQSGSIAATLLADLRRFGFSTVISSGNEAVVDLADYISYLAHDPATRVIAAFVESVRRPEAFIRALEEAVAELEGGYRAMVYPSGLAACAGALMSYVKAGDHVLIMSNGGFGGIHAKLLSRLAKTAA